MTTDTTDEALRARAHELLTGANRFAFKLCETGHTPFCDRLVALLRSHEEERERLEHEAATEFKRAAAGWNRFHEANEQWSKRLEEANRPLEERLAKAMPQPIHLDVDASGKALGHLLATRDAEVSTLRARVERAEGALRVRTVERDEWKHALMRIAKPNTLRNGPDYCETCLHDLAGERPCSSPCPGFIARAALSEPARAAFETGHAAAIASRDTEIAALRGEVERLTKDVDQNFHNSLHNAGTALEARAALAKVTAEREATRGQLAEARGLLERVVKYVVEDRATTPGVTRLARWTDKARAFLAQPATTPALVPASTVYVDSKPPVTDEQSSCGGCGRRSSPWEGWQRPDEGACWWLWEPAFQMWTFLCRDEREDEATPALVTTPDHAGPPWDTSRDAAEFEPLCYPHGGVNLTPNAVSRPCSQPTCKSVTFGVRMPAAAAGPLVAPTPSTCGQPCDSCGAGCTFRKLHEARGHCCESHGGGPVGWSPVAPTPEPARHVCKCSNEPCPVCGGGPSGEWHEGSEVKCDDCGTALYVAVIEECKGRTVFELSNGQPCPDCDATGFRDDDVGAHDCMACAAEGYRALTLDEARKAAGIEGRSAPSTGEGAAPATTGEETKR